jgi:hypothetical protein
MPDIFFSNENYKHICQQINQSVEFTFGISLANNKKYQNKISESMKCVYDNRHQFNIPLGISEQQHAAILSNKSVKYFMLYFEKSLNKKYVPNTDETHLTQPETTSLYGREYPPISNINEQNFMKINKNEDASFITNEYSDTASSESNDNVAYIPNNISSSKVFNNVKSTTNETHDKTMTKFEKEVGQLFYALKDSGNFKVNKYNLVIDTGDCVWGDPADNTPFNINVRFGMPSNNSSNQKGNNLYIKTAFKNIHSLKINRVVIPSKLMNEYKYPFLYLCIEEYESNVVTTGDIKNIFAKIYLNRNTSTEVGANHTCDGFMHFINIEGDIKTFKAPLTQLSKLSISLVSPSGKVMCSDLTANSGATTCDGTDYTPYKYVQYIFELATIENYIPHINSFPFNT